MWSRFLCMMLSMIATRGHPRHDCSKENCDAKLDVNKSSSAFLCARARCSVVKLSQTLQFLKCESHVRLQRGGFSAGRLSVKCHCQTSSDNPPHRMQLVVRRSAYKMQIRVLYQKV